MSKQELEDKYNALENHILELIIRYIDPHMNPMERPEDYNLDVHSFCILCHAAFEEFLEDVTLYSVEKIESEFHSRPRKFSYATLCLLHFDEKSMPLTDEKKWGQKLNEYINNRINDRKSELSKYAKTDNHGIDIKYLRRLLMPVGIDVPDAPTEISSLTTLKNVRGAYAHSYDRNKKPIAPEDAQRVVYDVLTMIDRIKKKALTMSYYVL